MTDPVAYGLVASLARPGGNVTGMASQVDLAFYTKRLQLLLDAAPGVTRIAVLQHGAFVRAVPARARMQQLVVEAAQSLGVDLQMVEVNAPEELEGAFAAMTREGAEALSLINSPIFGKHPGRM